MKRVMKVLIWLVVLTGILYAGYRGLDVFLERKGAARVKSTAEETVADPIKVAVSTVKNGTITESIWVTGEVRALAAVDVTPKVSGRLERLRLPDGTLIEEGVEVEKGQIVAVIEHEQRRATVKASEAALALARASNGRAKVNLADARRERNRWIKLRKSGAGTEQQFDQTMTAFDRARAELKIGEARIFQAEAALEQAKVNLAESMLPAPISGIVSRKYVDEGAFVGPSVPLFKVVDIRMVEITGGVADKHYPSLKVDRTRAEIEVDAYPGKRFSGTVSRVSPELDRVTRTVAVTIRAPNERRRIKPGMYARIRLVLKERKEVPLVSDEALMVSEEGLRVFVVAGDTIHTQRIRIGLEEGNLNEALEGLRAGERVVIRGHQLVREGKAIHFDMEDKP